MDKNLEKRIQEFKKENPTGIILIYGPTGCGKTALSLDVAHMTDGEIVSVDARQIYCGLDI
ncbi:MAG: isopentenyl transferase family protein [Patescibacteria group bacterium]